jgi:LEA14-like dessication related protein
LGFYLYQVYSFKEKLEYAFKGIRVKSISLSGVSLSIKLLITNKSSVSLLIKSYNINVYANSTFITNVHTTTPFELDEYSKKEIDISAVLDPKSIGGIANIVMNLKQIKSTIIKVDGTITVEKFKTPLRIPLKFEDSIATYMEG